MKKAKKKLRQTPLRLAKLELEVLKTQFKVLQEKLDNETARANDSYKQVLAKSHELNRALERKTSLEEEVRFMRTIMTNLAVAIKGRLQ